MIFEKNMTGAHVNYGKVKSKVFSQGTSSLTAYKPYYLSRTDVRINIDLITLWRELVGLYTTYCRLARQVASVSRRLSRIILMKFPIAIKTVD